MKKQRVIIVLAIAAAVASALGFKALGERAQAPKSVTTAARPIPEHVPYMFLFNQHYANLQKADELERQGQSGEVWRSVYKRKASLSEEQSRIFDQVTLDCQRELAAQDAKAQAIIDAVKAKYPDGKLPEGVVPPPPPQELSALQQERNAIILRARDRLHQQYGDQEFERFDAFIQAHVAPALHRVNHPGAQH